MSAIEILCILFAIAASSSDHMIATNGDNDEFKVMTQLGVLFLDVLMCDGFDRDCFEKLKTVTNTVERHHFTKYIRSVLCVIKISNAALKIKNYNPPVYCI